MMESITAVAWAFSTAKMVLQSEHGKKFIESTIGKIAEKMTETSIKKIGELKEMIASKLQGNLAAVDAFSKAETFGSEQDLRAVAHYLSLAAKKDEMFAQQVQCLIQEIQTLVQFDDVNAQNAQQIFGGQGLQVNAPQKHPILQIQGNPTVVFGRESD
jgi:hypothetical protein